MSPTGCGLNSACSSAPCSAVPLREDRRTRSRPFACARANRTRYGGAEDELLVSHPDPQPEGFGSGPHPRASRVNYFVPCHHPNPPELRAPERAFSPIKSRAALPERPDRIRRGRGCKCETAAAQKDQGRQAHNSNVAFVPRSRSPATGPNLSSIQPAHDRVAPYRGTDVNVADSSFFHRFCYDGFRDRSGRRSPNGRAPI